MPRSTDKPSLDYPEKSEPPKIELPRKGSIVRSLGRRGIEPGCLLEALEPDTIRWMDRHGWFMGVNCNHPSSTHSWTYGRYEVLKAAQW